MTWLNQNKNKTDIQQTFAFFDFDGTLTRSDSLMLFLKYCVGTTVYYTKLIGLSPIILGYFAKLIANDKAKEQVMAAYIGGWHQRQLVTFAHAFVSDVLPNRLRKAGMEKLYYHQAQGHYCVLVSASPEVYVVPWAKQHGFDAVIGTQLDLDNDIVTGNIAGDNCYGTAKVKRIIETFGENCWQGSFAYSDSTADLPMLARANQAYLLKHDAFMRLQQEIFNE